jgi:hypothetical protein
MSIASHPAPLPGASQRSVHTKQIIYLTQADVREGTKFLRQSHTRYVLTEDIVFDPQVPHDPAQFVLGFFAAFAITGSHVELDLNGFTLQQSERHRKQQRFFALIELGNSPFETGQGPANFGQLESPSFLKIHNGTLGLSAHHGIHGNRNHQVSIEHLRIVDFEVAGLHFNNPTQLIIRQCQIGPSNRQVPVRGRFSAATFLLPVLQSIDPTKSLARADGHSITVKVAAENLQQAMDTMDPLFQNPSGFNDGTVYGIVVNQRGVAVHDFASTTHVHPADNVTIANTCMERLHAAPQEIVGLACDAKCHHAGYTSGKVQADVFGAVFDIALCEREDGTYRPNPLADAQLLVYKHLNKGTISPDVVAWAEGTQELTGKTKVYGLDSMAHVIKGNIGIFLNSVTDFNVQHCSIDSIHNLGVGNAAGIVLAACQRGVLNHLQLNNIAVASGQPTGIRGIGDSHQHLSLDTVHVTNTDGIAFSNMKTARLSRCVGCIN